MTTAFVVHEVEDGNVWAKAWHQGPGSRHELFAELGLKARNFRDPNNPNLTGVLLEIPDLEKFQALLASDRGQQAMKEDRLRVDTMRLLTEFSP